MASQLPFYKLTKAELLNEIQTTNQKIQEQLNNQNFTKYIQSQTPQSTIMTKKCKYYNIEDIPKLTNKANSKQKATRSNTQTNIVHFNIRSLDKHFSELMAFNTQTKEKFQYIALSEIGKKT